MNIIEVVQSSPLVWVLSIIVIGGITYLFRLSSAQRRSFREAGNTIAVNFKLELDALIQTRKDARIILTNEAYLRHESAIRNNINLLPWLDQFRLRRAWNKLAYHPQDKKKQIPFYENYADCGSLNKRREMRPLAISRIQKIISIVS